MTIRKLPGKELWRLFSKKSHKNLGTFKTPELAENHERQIEYFRFLSKKKTPKKVEIINFKRRNFLFSY